MRAVNPRAIGLALSVIAALLMVTGVVAMEWGLVVGSVGVLLIARRPEQAEESDGPSA